MPIEWIVFVAVAVLILTGFAMWVWHKGIKQVIGKWTWKAPALLGYLLAVDAMIALAVQYWSSSRFWLPWAATGAIFAGFAIWVWLQEGWPRLTTPPDGRMQLWKASFLVVYLVLFTLATTYAVQTLWQADPQLPMQVPPGEPTCGDVKPDAGPVIKDLDPAKLMIGTERTDILVLGCNFVDGDRVSFGSEIRLPNRVDDKHLKVSLATADFRSPGTMQLKVVPAAPAQPSNAVPLTIDSATRQTAKWQFLWWSPVISEDLRLLLLVLFAGTLGSCVYALKSIGDFIGTRILNESWFTYYFIQPFEGAGVATIFYFLIRGGFLAGTSADLKSVNPFGLCAVAALVGVFSDLAFMKLREIFNTLFKPDDARNDKISDAALSITAKSPLPDAVQNTPYTQTLQLDGGKKPFEWEAVTPLPDGLSLDKKQGILSGMPTAVTARKKYTFKVTDSVNNSATADLELEVKKADQ